MVPWTCCPEPEDEMVVIVDLLLCFVAVFEVVLLWAMLCYGCWVELPLQLQRLCLSLNLMRSQSVPVSLVGYQGL